MNFSEEKITKIVGFGLIVFGLGIIINDLMNGYSAFVLFLLPLLFIAVGIISIFKDDISKVFSSQIMNKLRDWIYKNSDFVFFIFPLSIFSIIGFTLTYFALKMDWNVTIGGWITLSLFSFFPLVMIFLIVFGYNFAKKKEKEIENNLTFNEEGITIEMPLYDKRCLINWQTIDAIIYYNYMVSSDFTDHYEGYKFYLNSLPVYTKYDKQWWWNKLFPKESNSGIIDINNETKNFRDIPNNVEKYLKTKVNINFDHPAKGSLISKEISKSGNKTTKIENWKPNNKDSHQIVFDKFNRTIEQILAIRKYL